MKLTRLYKTAISQKSIKTSISIILILMILMIVVIFFASYYSRNQIIKEYQYLNNINIKLNQLSLTVSENIQNFERYYQNRDKQHLQAYNESRKTAENLLDELEEEFSRDRDSLIFSRTFSNMMWYYNQQAGKLFTRANYDEEAYSIFRNIKTLHSYMNNHVQLLLISYHNYSSKRYLELLDNFRIRERNIYVVLIFLGFMFLVSARLLSNRILTEIDKLTMFARKLSEGHWEIENIAENRYLELSILARTFNIMKNNIRKYIEKLKKKAKLEKQLSQIIMKNIEKDKLLRESQLMTLQNQVNPHFLFNTLNTISRTALFEGASQAVSLIDATASIMRYNLENKGKPVELKRELEILQAYITIQKVRFQHRIVFTLDITFEPTGIKVPPMIIQPLVENSIVHGLEDRREGGFIRIFLKMLDNSIEITVEDNGKGIKPQKIKEIFSDNVKNENSKNNTGIGLQNLRKRLELYFGKRDLLFIESNYGQGTVVKLILPVAPDNLEGK